MTKCVIAAVGVAGLLSNRALAQPNAGAIARGHWIHAARIGHAPKLNAYRQVNLVSNMPEVEPQILDPLLLDAWGITIRPAGAGGHWWVTNTASGTVTTYVGDAPGVPLYQDELRVVRVPPSRLYKPWTKWSDYTSQPTGQVYTGWSNTDFIVSGDGVTGAAKFVFVALDGSISGWRDGMVDAVNVIDESESGAMYTGCAVTENAAGNRLYVCDFGLECMKVFDHEYKPVTVSGDFKYPGIPEYYTPWNAEFEDGLLYVTFARQGDDPGEEDAYPGYGYVGVFDLEGHFLRGFEHTIELNAPWGVAFAPEDFGAMSGTILISNFGDGRILCYNRETLKFIDYLRDVHGRPVEIDGIWGLIYGNGVRLGYKNHLYFAAGPNEEQDGIFGKLVPLTP